jgi:putative endonuclease
MFVYALVNKQNRIYVGMSQSLSKRLKDHNYGRVFSTKGFRPWRVLYKEECPDRKNARVREKYLKSGVGKEFLKSKISPL